MSSASKTSVEKNKKKHANDIQLLPMNPNVGKYTIQGAYEYGLENLWWSMNPAVARKFTSNPIHVTINIGAFLKWGSWQGTLGFNPRIFPNFGWIFLYPHFFGESSIYCTSTSAGTARHVIFLSFDNLQSQSTTGPCMCRAERLVARKKLTGQPVVVMLSVDSAVIYL